jgi:hypothetical protein
VAMVGKECVAIASDLRLGNQALTIATNFEKARSNYILADVVESRSIFVDIPCDRSYIPRPSWTGD